MGVDWFRSPDWNEPARTAFEARLARARPRNRQQYLRIKGLALRAAGHTAAARELLERAADHPDGHFFMTVSAWESLADMAVERGDRATAEQLYRRIVIEQPSGSGTTGGIEISLAELLLDKGDPDARDEALALLDSWMGRPRMKFDNQLFRWHLNLIRIAEAAGDRDAVRRAANSALTLAGRGPQLSRHPDVGLVRADEAILERLRALAT